MSVWLCLTCVKVSQGPLMLGSVVSDSTEVRLKP